MNNFYDIKLIEKESALSAEELLTMFNRNISKNAEILDYIGKNNLFGIIGKARNEGVHSRFVAELLSGEFFNVDSRESTLYHFMDLLLYRSAKENKSGNINPQLKKAILIRAAVFEKVESVCELSVKNYQTLSGYNNTKPADKDDRIDIYLKYKLINTIAGRDTLEIFIENKVNSSEFDSQTTRYFEACDNGGRKRPFQLFVYITPQPLRDMEKYISLDSKCKPVCAHYIHICYQDMLDYIIEPLLSDKNLDADKKTILNEYVRCLELPTMPDMDSQLTTKDLSIMATSSKEKKLVQSFMEDPVNQRIIEKSIAAKLNMPLYSVASCGTLFNATEALTRGIEMLINIYHEPLQVLRAVADCKIAGPQKGADPFLVYSPVNWHPVGNRLLHYLPFDHLYLYSNRVYSSITSAFSDAIKDYMERNHKTDEELIKDFANIFSAKGGGLPLVSGKKESGNGKAKIDGLFIRKKIPADRLPGINSILGEDLSIEPIDEEAYNALMQCNIQLYINQPITENKLPDEVGKLIRDVDGENYVQVDDTPFFIRKDIVDDKILGINQIKILENEDIIGKCKDISILIDFFNNRRNLILSVYKIQLEAEPDQKVYEEKLTVYRKLLKA